jgi:peptide deformylase
MLKRTGYIRNKKNKEMIHPIYVYGMPVLRKVAQDIDEDYAGLEQLIEDMYETMYQADGVGLAAPQIGKSIRLIVIDGTKVEEDDEEEHELQDFKKVLINPRLVSEEGEEWEYNEGCLSIPNIREDVKRKPNIRLEYLDEHFNFHDEEFSGMKARVLQHEMDHVNGILFTDRISPLRKRLLTPKLKAISKGHTDVKYRIRNPKK